MYDNLKNAEGEHENLIEEMDNINGLLETCNSKIQETIITITNTSQVSNTQVKNSNLNSNQGVRRAKKGNTGVEDAGDKKILNKVREQWDIEMKSTIPAKTTGVSNKPGYSTNTVLVVGVVGLILLGMIIGGLIANHFVNKCLKEKEDEGGDMKMEYIEYNDVYHTEEWNTSLADIDDSSKYNWMTSNESSYNRTIMNVSSTARYGEIFD